jgi:hypothetical protein
MYPPGTREVEALLTQAVQHLHFEHMSIEGHGPETCWSNPTRMPDQWQCKVVAMFMQLRKKLPWLSRQGAKTRQRAFNQLAMVLSGRRSKLNVSTKRSSGDQSFPSKSDALVSKLQSG